MLNGRCNTASDFTSISVKGVAVVDYVIVNKDLLHICTGIEIISATDLFQNAGLRGRCNPEHRKKERKKESVYFDKIET